MRALTRSDAAAAAHYDAAVARHRVLAGGSAAQPSGFERRRMMDAVLDATAVSGSATSVAARRVRLPMVLATGLALAVLAAVAVPRLLPAASEAPEVEWIAARGGPTGTFDDRLVGIGLAGVTEAGTEYEAVATDAAYADDYLRLTYTNQRAELTHLFVFGLQPERAAGERVTWIAPLPDEGESLAVGPARMSALFEVRVAARHVPGRLRVVALFTARALTVAEVEGALDAGVADLPGSALERTLVERLRLGPDAVVQVLETRVRAGSQAGEEGP